ncbi:Cyclin-dependent protein kinase [Melia azedarach]|uniref:Cyclin-dependent protein kinase n=1 Tax=Melia azedarach TaxID=155640 RepID=A0ACC1X4Q3_MELAZ|nr:Cyclin-dependent protein kinase [Melia azedarach]
MEFSCSDSNVNNGGCATPKGKRFRIPEKLSCPPAPMKKRVAPAASRMSSNNRSSPITYFTPPDIELFFLFSFQNISAS